jgi:polysaccharide biosynthesis protein PslH
LKTWITSAVNVLIVSPADITDPRGGAGNRALNLAKGLKKGGNTVIVLQSKKPANRQAQSNDFEIHTYFQTIGKRELFFFNDINPFFWRAIVKILTQRSVDIIHVELPWGVAAVWALTKLIGNRQKVVYSSQNIEASVEHERARLARTEKRARFLDIIIAYTEALNTRIVEPFAAHLSDVILCVSDADKVGFMDMYGINADKIELVPNGTALQEARSASRDKDSFGLDESKLAVVFHGTYAYAPNKEAIRCIIDQIAPYVRGRHEPEFVIAGNGVPQCELGSNVKCLGFVDEIYTLLKSSDIAIVPLQSGGGTRLKILDYFAAGLPVVTTRKGVEGIAAINQTHALIVDDTEEFIEALAYLIDHEKERKRLGTNAFELVESQYDWEIIGQRLNRLYTGLKK